MPRLSKGLIPALAVLVANAVTAQFGSLPPKTLGARDLASEYHLPLLNNRRGDAMYDEVAKSQVLTRAERLGLSPWSATEAWKESASTYGKGKSVAELPFPGNATLFRGSRASELNRRMALPGRCVIRVVSPLLLVDQPLYLRDHCSLDLGLTSLKSRGYLPYLIQIKERTDVRVSGGVLKGRGWGVSVAHSSEIVLTGMRMERLGGGVMVTNSYAVTVAHNHFSGLSGAGIMLHGDTKHAVILENDVLDGTGWSNWHAGIVITDRNAEPADDSTTLLRDDGILVSQTKITDRLTIPHDNVVLRNTISGNKTSGIYSDGGARNVILDNKILGNSKEGMCLDNGSTSNVVAYNLFRGNGKRWGMTDAELKRDFVGSYGRLDDGTSPAKLPGISMDNAAYNQVVFNQIDHNFGSGIRMVRTAFYNLVGANTLTDDNEGSNSKLHYFGILVGNARSDEAAWDLDFLPSHGNLLFSNNILGKHYAGVDFESGADHNTVIDNSIFGATVWAMDNFQSQPQATVNNLSDVPFRGIASGLDPRLLSRDQGKRK